jgi:hypothetical protein
MSLFNDSMSNAEDNLAFRSRFDGVINQMSRCKIVIPPLLIVMFFLCSLHSRYSPLLDQFHSCACSLEKVSLDSNDEFNVVGKKDNKPAKGPKASAAAAAPASTPSKTVNRDGKVWNNPFEWLAKIKIDSVKRR